MPSTTALDSKHVVVVGGTSGIGRATALAAREAGAAVTVIGRDPDRLRRAATDDRLGAITADVLDPAALRQAFGELPDVDHLVVTAGVAVLSSFLDGGPAAAQLDGGFRTKVEGAANVIQAAHPRLRDRGSVVLTGGVSTDRPVPGAWTTSIATAAVEQLARALALELAPLRVNAISPGWTRTPMWDAVLGDAAPDVLDDARAGTLTGAIADPADVAAAVVALLANPAITGAVLHVDSGARLT